MRFIAIVLLYDVGAMWVRVVLCSCRWNFCLWLLLRLRHVGRCDGVRRVVVFCNYLLKKFSKLSKRLHLFVTNVSKWGTWVGFWRACVNLHAVMVAFPLTICMAFFRSVVKLYSVCDSFMCGVVCINGVAEIII